MRHRRLRPTGRALRYLAALAGGLLAADAATAFYFAGWPGDGRPRQRTLVSPSASLVENPPSAREETEWYQERPRVERPHDHDHEHPAETPEPGTLVTAAIGAAVIGLASRRRKK